MRKIVFSPYSKFQLDSLLDYLEIKFSVSTKKKFVLKLDKVIIIIQKDPDTFSKSNNNIAIRKCVISKQTTLYYRYNNQEIRLLSLFDTRQNPTKINKIK
jgi:plasmid stabilization system protein ParE